MPASQSELHRNLGASRKTNQEGVIVWDQKGVVIMWQDGHRSRFSWQALRGNCACTDCQPRSPQNVRVERNAAEDTRLFG